MTREDTVGLVRSIVDLYPNWKPSDLSETVNAWHWMLEEYPASAVKAALQIYVKTNDTGFAPSVSQIIACMYKAKANDQLSEGEAWEMVKRGIADGIYNAREHFDKFPKIVQRAVGSPSMLRQWAATDSDDVNTVIMSNFQRTYRALLARQEFEDKIPAILMNEATKRIEADV